MFLVYYTAGQVVKMHEGKITNYVQYFFYE